MGNYTQRALNSLAAEYEVAEVLEHFNSAYIYDVIQNKINAKFIPSMTITGSNPNIVLSFEENFNRCKQTYPDDIVNIESVRIETYREIIDIIKANYNFEVRIPDNTDPYPFAYFYYDFFVCNFTNYIAKFFAMYIFNNKDNLYNALGLEAYKKSKDGATAYGRKVYEDSKLAVISANIVMVVNALKAFDITPDIIFSALYDKAVVDMMTNSLLLQYDMFKQLFYTVPSDYEAILFTNIRLELQQMAQRSGGLDYL